MNRIVGRTVGRNAVPGRAMVAAAEQEWRADVDRALFVRRKRDRRVPVVAQLLLVAALGLDIALLERVAIDSADMPALRFGVGVIRVRRIGEGPEAVAAEQIFPAVVSDPARVFAVADPGRIVLQPAIDLIGVLVVGADVIELADRQVVGLPPAIGAVVGVPEAAVVAAHGIFGIVRVDPDVVPVAVRPARGVGETLAAVFRYRNRKAHLEQAVGVLG